VTEVSYAHQSSLHLIKNTVIALLLLLQNIFRERERERERGYVPRERNRWIERVRSN